MKKGQAALEFMTTYGWAILAVVAAITALAYFGVLTPGAYVPPACAAEPPFACSQFKAQASTGVFTEIINGGGGGIVDVTVDFSDNEGNICNASSVVWPVAVAAGGSITGQYILWDTGTCANQQELDIFRGNFTIQYRNAGDTVSHIARGSIVAKVEN